MGEVPRANHALFTARNTGFCFWPFQQNRAEAVDRHAQRGAHSLWVRQTRFESSDTDSNPILTRGERRN